MRSKLITYLLFAVHNAWNLIWNGMSKLFLILISRYTSYHVGRERPQIRGGLAINLRLQ